MISQKKGKTPGRPPHLTVLETTGVQKVVEDSNFTRILGANVQANLTWNTYLETGNKAVLPTSGVGSAPGGAPPRVGVGPGMASGCQGCVPWKTLPQSVEKLR